MYYIGQTRTRLKKRDWQHKRGVAKGSFFDKVYHKHQEDFVLEIVSVVISNSKQHLVNILNELEIKYIKQYRESGCKLYNILEGGNVGWKNITPTEKMLQALEYGRNLQNQIQKQNKFSEEEIRERHKFQCRKYVEHNKERYIETYTKQNNKRKDYKHDWYIKNKERILQKQKLRYHSRRQKVE